MTKDDIMSLALESGMSFLLEEHASEYGNGTFWNTPYPELERFAKLVAAFAAEREREECAKWLDFYDGPNCRRAEAIRARRNHD